MGTNLDLVRAEQEPDSPMSDFVLCPYQFSEPTAGADGASFPAIPTWKRFVTTSIVAIGTVSVPIAIPLDLVNFQNVAIVVPTVSQVRTVSGCGVEGLGYGEIEVAPDYGPDVLNAASVAVIQSIIDARVPDIAFDQLEMGE